MKRIILIVCLYFYSSHSFGQLPFIETFESGTFPPTGWHLNPAGSPSWVLDSTVSAYGIGTSCISFDNFTNTTGTFDIRLPQLNMAQAQLPFIRFDIAYAMQPTTVTSDEIGIWSSTNNSTWTNLQNYSGNSLATAAPVPNPYAPIASDWRTTFFPLTWVTGQAHVYLQLENICHGGNKVYIDNIRVYDSATVGIQEPDAANLFSAYPNPASDVVKLKFNHQDVSSEFSVYNSQGEVVIHETITNEDEELNSTSWTDGIYFLKLAGHSSGRVILKTRL